LVPIATVTVLVSLLLVAPGAGKKVSDSLADVRYDCVSPDVTGPMAAGGLIRERSDCQSERRTLEENRAPLVP
jgi:hypothetical protein